MGRSLWIPAVCLRAVTTVLAVSIGGVTTYQKAKNDILRWLREDTGAYVTTMFDFFRLPTDFPEYQRAMECPDHLSAVHILEQGLKADSISDTSFQGKEERFIPYIQLHEFEALLFTDVRVLKEDYLEIDEQKNLDQLYEETKGIPPEEINHGAETAPSKRLLHAVDYQKSDPCAWIEALTVEAIRGKCPHFSEWLGRLEKVHTELQHQSAANKGYDALIALQQSSKENGLQDMTLDEINAEIRLAREERHG